MSVEDAQLTSEEAINTMLAVAAELQRRAARGSTPEEVRKWIVRASDVRRSLQGLADAYHQALHEEWAGVVVARKIERSVRAHQTRLDRERRREQGGMYVGEKRSPNRPTQVEVDPEAWTVVKADAVKKRRAVAKQVGDLVRRAVADQAVHQHVHVAGSPKAPAPRSHPKPQKRFARLFVDDDTWSRFRTQAAQREVPVARLVGIVVEDEARMLGWRPSDDPR